MKRKTIKPEFQAEAAFTAEVFNLAWQATGDGWQEAAERTQTAADRAQAATRQPDMFPDTDVNPARQEARPA